MTVWRWLGDFLKIMTGISGQTVEDFPTAHEICNTQYWHHFILSWSCDTSCLWSKTTDSMCTALTFNTQLSDLSNKSMQCLYSIHYALYITHRQFAIDADFSWVSFTRFSSVAVQAINQRPTLLHTDLLDTPVQSFLIANISNIDTAISFHERDLTLLKCGFWEAWCKLAGRIMQQLISIY